MCDDIFMSLWVKQEEIWTKVVCLNGLNTEPPSPAKSKLQPNWKLKMKHRILSYKKFASTSLEPSTSEITITKEDKDLAGDDNQKKKMLTKWRFTLQLWRERRNRVHENSETQKRSGSTEACKRFSTWQSYVTWCNMYIYLLGLVNSWGQAGHFQTWGNKRRGSSRPMG